MLNKVIEGADDRGIQVTDQHLDHGSAEQQLAAGPHLLTYQKQRRPQGHARRCHRRRQRQDADQVDAKAGPGEQVALLGVRQGDNVTQRIDQCHDVADHRQETGVVLDPVKRNHTIGGGLQPGIESRCTAGDVLNVDGIEWNDGSLGLTFCDSSFSGHYVISPGDKVRASRAKIEDLNERARKSRLSEVRIKVKKRN
ncbi:hypothetical protein EMIT0232MI5_140002 [Pseudomonas sp. IT-232MI5]